MDSNDPIQDATGENPAQENDLQQSPAQDVDMATTQQALYIAYSLSAAALELEAFGNEEPFEPITPNSSFVEMAFQVSAGGANTIQNLGLGGFSVISPLGPIVNVNSLQGETTSESDANNFYCAQGFISGGNFAFNYGYKNIDWFPTGQLYADGVFGAAYNASVTAMGNIFFIPGTWSCTLSGGNALSTPVMNCTGSFTVAGVEVSTFSNAGGFSALAGTANPFQGTINFVVPAGGGFFTGVWNTLVNTFAVEGINNVGVGASFSWLHA